MTAPVIDILLATYNGTHYLDDLLDSLLRQTDPGWRLLARDDGSDDATGAILERFRAAHADKVAVIDDGRGNLGAVGNFSALMAASTADYVMFCDQDDVWLPSKTARLRSAMQALEARHGGDTPLLVHCDLRVVDQDLHEIAPSFWRYQDLDAEKGAALNRLLVRNLVTGCAMMMNRPLKELVEPIPSEAIMHDWWVALMAAACGRIGCLSEALVLYRQHGGNAIGAGRPSLPALARKLALSGGAMYCRNKQALADSQGQAAALLRSRGDAMAAGAGRIVTRYASLSERGPLTRRLDLIRYGFLFDGYLRNTGLFALI